MVGIEKAPALNRSSLFIQRLKIYSDVPAVFLSPEPKPKNQLTLIDPTFSLTVGNPLLSIVVLLRHLCIFRNISTIVGESIRIHVYKFQRLNHVKSGCFILLKVRCF